MCIAMEGKKSNRITVEETNKNTKTALKHHVYSRRILPNPSKTNAHTQAHTLTHTIAIVSYTEPPIFTCSLKTSKTPNSGETLYQHAVATATISLHTQH
jgi:hypothetical protein